MSHHTIEFLFLALSGKDSKLLSTEITLFIRSMQNVEK